jgi:ATP-dependent DNA helicase RecG
VTRSTGAGDPTGSGAQPPEQQPPEQQAPDQQPLDQQPVEQLKRVGPRVRERLAKLGIHRVQDLLFHLPLRW